VSFTDYIDTPFQPYILPIIPRGAKLSPHSKLTPDRIGKIPGIRYPEGWGGFGKQVPWQKHVSTARFLNGLDDRYLRDGLVPTIGVQARILIAVDIDFDNPEFAELIMKLACEDLGVAPVRFRSNSAKILLPYRLKEEHGARGVTKQRALYRTMFGEEGAVEILGAGQQWLIEGMHPSGVLYEWRMGITPLAYGFHKLAEVTADQVDAFMARLKGKRGTATATGLLDSRGSSGSARADSVDVPWQQFGDPIDGVIGDAGKHVAQVGFGVEAVQFRRLDQRVHGGGTLAAAVGAGEEPILSAQSQGPDGALGGIV
jgi:hypothetical protein